MNVTSQGLRRLGFNRWGVLLAPIALLAIAIAAANGAHFAPAPSANNSQRYVSLSPAITATLVAIGARPQLAGVSDYCHFAVDVGDVPRVGGAYTPRYEAIVALSPSMIFVEAVNAPHVAQLTQVIRVEALPWLTLDEVIASTRKLGAITGHAANADELASSYEHLQPRVTPNSPRVLLVMAHVPGSFKEVVFIRKNSIHGRMLEAAGARNAVDEEVTNAPRLSLEQAILRDPDGIVILQSASQADPRLLEDWRSLSVLRAVKTNQISIIAAIDVAIPDPQLLELVKRLASVVGAWKKAA
jgi:ABC-type Fe3+-hydroxamate transport system substrate-binding protein